jgi:hypothetical protein
LATAGVITMDCSGEDCTTTGSRSALRRNIIESKILAGAYPARQG